MAILTGPQTNQFPEDTQPENRLDIDPDMFSVPFYRSYLLNGVYLQILAAHFSDPDNIHDAVIRTKIERQPYTTDDQTGVLIKTVADWQPNAEEKRPAVLINRGEVEIIRLGIGDSAGANATTGEQTWMVQLGGHHVLFVIGRVQAEADLLAFETARMLMVAIPLIRCRARLDRLQMVSIGEAAQLEESKDHYAVPIVIAYKLLETYSTQPHVPVLKRISPAPVDQ